MYAKQASNTIAERNACDIRLRAERKIGQMLAELQRATAPNPSGLGGHTNKVVTSNDVTQQTKSEYAATLEQTGISRQTVHRYQRLAEPQSTSDG